LDSDATILPGFSLSFKSGTIATVQDSSSCFTSPLSFVVKQPAQPLQVISHLLSSSQSLGACDSLHLDATLSAGSGGRKFWFDWFLVPSHQNPNAHLVNELLASFNNRTGAIFLDSSYIIPGQTYEFAVQVSNFLGSSSSASITIHKYNAPRPLVTIDGTSPLIVYRGDAVDLRASASLPILSCDYVTFSGPFLGTLEYFWSETTGFLGGTLPPSNDPSHLLIPSDLLQPQHMYTFNVMVAMSHDLSVNNSAQFSVLVQAQSLVSLIAGGNRTVSLSDTLVLDASSSYDPDNEPGTLLYSWMCTTLDLSPCIQASGQVFAMTLSLPKYSVSAGLFAPGSFFFTVHVSKDSRHSASTVIIQFTSNVPQVTVFGPTNPVSIATAPFVELTGIASSTLGVQSVYWKKSLGLEASAGRNFFVLGQTALTAVIDSGSLLGGFTYTFTMYAEDTTGATGFASLNIYVNAPPRCGFVSASPSEGFALSTEFGLVSQGWVDPDGNYPLQYSFQYSIEDIYGNSTAWIALSDFSRTPFFEAYLPPGNGPHYIILVVGIVQDSLLAEVNASYSIKVQPFVSSNLEGVIFNQTSSIFDLYRLQSASKMLVSVKMIADYVSKAPVSSSTYGNLSDVLLSYAINSNAITDTTPSLLNQFAAAVFSVMALTVDVSPYAEIILNILDESLSYCASEGMGVSSTTLDFIARIVSVLMRLSSSGTYTDLFFNIMDDVASLLYVDFLPNTAVRSWASPDNQFSMSVARDTPSHFVGSPVQVKTAIPAEVVEVGHDDPSRVNGLIGGLAYVDTIVVASMKNLFSSTSSSNISSVVTSVKMMDPSKAPIDIQKYVSPLTFTIPLLAPLQITPVVLNATCTTPGDLVVFACPVKHEVHLCRSTETGKLISHLCHTYSPNCQFWEPLDTAWSSYGCNVTSYTSTHVHCQCYFT